MAISVTLDVASVNGSPSGATAEKYGNTGMRATRVGIAEGLPSDTATMEAADVLFRVMTAPGMPAMGSPHPTRPGIYLQNIVVTGQGPNWATFQLKYDGFAGVQSAYIVEDSTIDGTTTTNLMPGKIGTIAHSGKPFVLAFVSTDKKFEEMAKPDYAELSLPLGGRRLTVTKLMSGTLDPEAIEAFNDANELRVNQYVWLGKPPGAWLIMNAAARVSRYAGYYQTQISAVRRGDMLWSYYVTMRSRRTGMVAGGLPGTADDIQPRIETLMNLPYAPRTIRYPNQDYTKGVMRVDPFLWANFQTIFGFGTPGDSLGAPFDDLIPPSI